MPSASEWFNTVLGLEDAAPFRTQPFNDDRSYHRDLAAYETQISAAQDYAAQITPEQAVNVTNYAEAYPGVDPGVAMSMGQSGVDPFSDLGRGAATTSYAQNARAPQSQPNGPRNGRVERSSPEQNDAEHRYMEAEASGLIGDHGMLQYPGDDASDEQMAAFDGVLESMERLGSPVIYMDDDQTVMYDPAADAHWNITRFNPDDPDNFDGVSRWYPGTTEPGTSPDAELPEEAISQTADEMFPDPTRNMSPEAGGFLAQFFDSRGYGSVFDGSLDTLAESSVFQGEDPEQWQEGIAEFFADEQNRAVYDQLSVGDQTSVDAFINMSSEMVTEFHEDESGWRGFVQDNASWAEGAADLVPDVDLGTTIPGTDQNIEASFSAAKATLGEAIDVGAAALPDSTRQALSRWSRAGARTTFMMMDFPLQMSEAWVRNMGGQHGSLGGGEMGLSGGIQSLQQLTGQTDLGQAATALHEGRPVDVGTGYFVDDESQIGQARFRAEGQPGQIQGHNITLGRLSAQTAGLDPDSASWNTMSGIIDAGMTLFGDPATYATGGLTRARNVSRQRGVFRADDAFTTSAYPSGFGRYINFPDPNPNVVDLDDINRSAQDLVDGRPGTPVDPDDLPQPGSPTWNSLGRGTGMLAGTHPQLLDRPTPLSFLNSRNGRRITESIASETSPAVIWRNMGRRDLELASELASTRTAEEVTRILEPRLGSSSFRHTDDVWSPSRFDALRRGELWDAAAFNRVHIPRPGVQRWLHQIPSRRVNLDDPSDVATQIERLAANARMPMGRGSRLETRLNNLSRTGTRHERWEQYTGFVNDDMLAHAGVSDPVRRNLSTLYRDDNSLFRAYNTDEMGQPIHTWNEIIPGTNQTAPSPFVSNELVGQFAPTPDYERIRRTTSRLGRLLSTDDAELAPVASRVLRIQDEWKGLTITRPAYVLRTMPENMARMWFNGYSTFNHPIDYVMSVIARPRDRRLVEGRRGIPGLADEQVAPDTPSVPFQTATDPLSRIRGRALGDDVDDPLGQSPADYWAELESSMTSSRGDYLNMRNTRARIRNTGDRQFRRPADLADTTARTEYSSAWAYQFENLYKSPEVRMVAENGVESAHHYLMTTDRGKAFREMWAQHGHPQYLSNDAPTILHRHLEAIEENIQKLTGGSPELRGVISRGKLGDQTLLTGEGMRNPSFTRSLDSYLDDYGAPVQVAPEHIIESGPHRTRTMRALEAAMPGPVRRFARTEEYDKVVDFFFDAIVARPEDALSRSPVFYQAYWKRMDELADWAADPKDLAERLRTSQATVSAKGREWTVRSRTARNIERRGGRRPRTSTPNRLTFDEMNAAAASYAADEVKNLLYTATNRSQFMDANRAIFPFGEAWRDVMVSWSQYLRADSGRNVGAFLPNPRSYQTMHSIESLAGSGQFETNQYGEEVFSYPMPSIVNEQLLQGMPLPFQGSVDGLSMMTDVTPGIGPVAQVPVHFLLQQRPELQDTWGEMLLPFGTPWPEENPLEIANILHYMPPWVRYGTRALAGAPVLVGGEPIDIGGDQMWASAEMSMVQYEMSTGRWDLSDPAEVQAMMDHVERRMPGYFLVRTFGAFTAPSAPQPDWQVHDPDGNAVSFGVMRDTYWELVENNGVEEADQMFLNMFSAELLAMVSTGRSEARPAGRLPSTREFANWVNDNPDLRTAAPDVYPLLYPGETSDDYASAIYRRQLQAGERTELTPEQYIESYHDAIGQRMYRRATRQVGPDPAPNQTQWLSAYQRELMDAFPGYRRGGPYERADDDALRLQLRDALEHPSIADTDLAAATDYFLRAYDGALMSARENHELETLSGEEVRYLRDWLVFQVALPLTVDYPEFTQVYDSLFARELEDEFPEWRETQGLPTPQLLDPETNQYEQLPRSAYDVDDEPTQPAQGFTLGI